MWGGGVVDEGVQFLDPSTHMELPSVSDQPMSESVLATTQRGGVESGRRQVDVQLQATHNTD